MTREEAINEIKSWDFLNEKESEAIQTLIPELHESENERINKAIFKALSKKDARDVLLAEGVQVSEALAYLEKQKKPKKEFHIPDYIGVAHYNPVPIEQKEQKPNYCHHEVDETGWTEEYRKAYYDGWNNCNMQHEQLKADQKPAEWSEEDAKMLDAMIDIVSGSFYEPLCPRKEMLAWLKSLCPQPKKSSGGYITPHKEFFQWIYNRLINVHKENPDVDYMVSFKKRIDELSFDEPHWKPSEAQMEALKFFLDFHRPQRNAGTTNWREYDAVESLYKQLQKL